MNKILSLLLFIALFIPINSFSQIKKHTKLDNHVHLGIMTGKLKSNTTDMIDLKSDFAYNLSVGSTYSIDRYSTEKIKYGYTFDYISISQSNFKFIEKFYWKSENTDLQETSIGISAGGNCTLQFNKFFKMTLNAKYNPAYSKLNIDGVDYSYDLKGFSNSLLFGCDFSFNFIGTGIEYKISGVKYKLDNVQKDDLGINPVFINKLGTDKGNIISNYLNIYLTFNF